MRSLYEIGGDVLALNDLLEELEGDLSRAGELEPAVEAWLDGLATEQATKLDSYAGLIRTLEMESAAAKAEAEQWAHKARSRQARADYLTERLKQYMEATGQLKLQSATGRRLSVVKNGGKAPLVIDETKVKPADVPAEYQRQPPPEFARDKIRETLEAGGKLEWAAIGERGTRLTIK